MNLETKPVKFKQANNTLKAGLIEDCEDLPIYQDEMITISCWKTPLIKRLAFLFTGRIWLIVRGKTHPPLFIEANNPFIKELR